MGSCRRRSPGTRSSPSSWLAFLGGGERARIPASSHSLAVVTVGSLGWLTPRVGCGVSAVIQFIGTCHTYGYSSLSAQSPLSDPPLQHPDFRALSLAHTSHAMYSLPPPPLLSAWSVTAPVTACELLHRSILIIMLISAPPQRCRSAMGATGVVNVSQRALGHHGTQISSPCRQQRTKTTTMRMRPVPLLVVQ